MTISEISKALGISNATVSKALNGSSDISADTRRAICEYARSVGYCSRNASKPNGRVALLCDKELSDFPLLDEIARAFSAAAERARYVVVTEQIDSNSFDPNDYLAADHLYGAMLLGTEERSPLLRHLERTRFPIVLTNGFLTGNPLVSGVGSDLLHGTQEAVSYLCSLGHRKIAFLCAENSLTGAERFAGYTRGLLSHGLSLSGDAVFWGESCAADAAAAGGFTAAVCASDVIADRLISLARARGRRVPEELAVIGSDELNAPLSHPALTSLRQNLTELGRLGFTLLESMLKGMPAQRGMVGCTLVPGESA